MSGYHTNLYFQFLIYYFILQFKFLDYHLLFLFIERILESLYTLLRMSFSIHVLGLLFYVVVHYLRLQLIFTIYKLLVNSLFFNGWQAQVGVHDERLASIFQNVGNISLPGDRQGAQRNIG